MYYYTDTNNQTKGPVSLEDIQALVNAGALNASSMIAAVGSKEWSPIGTIIPALATAPIPPPPQSTSPYEPLAIASFVLSMLALSGFMCCALFICTIPGVICGHIALSNIGKNPQLQGKGFAIAGLIIGYISTALGIVGLIALFVSMNGAEFFYRFREALGH